MKTLCFVICAILFDKISCQQSASPQKTNYNQDEAKILLKLSADAYSSTPAICFTKHWNESQDYSIFDFYSPVCDEGSNHCTFFSIVSTVHKKIIIVFRGTESADQLNREFDQTNNPGVDFYGFGNVYKYFNDAHNLLWDRVIAIFEVPEYRNFEVVFTGHSLGGALASLGAMRARFEGYSKSKNIKAITFGQPRVGSYIWSQHFDKLIPQAFRVIHDQDIVPHIPSCKKDINSPLNNQTTNGNQICDGSGNDSFYHHGTEIWYPSGMEYGDIFYECLGLPKNEDFNCSDSLQYPMSQFNTFMDMHRYYFGMRVVSWGYSGCPEDVNATQPTGASLI